MDRIAASGLRFTNFHSTALCSPSRAALIAGRNHHSAGYGVVSELATGFPGYDSVIGKNNATIRPHPSGERLSHLVVHAAGSDRHPGTRHGRWRRAEAD